MADVIHTPEPPADAGTVTPGLLRRIIAFPLTLMVIEFAAVVLLASLYSTAVFHAGMPKDGPLHLLGALVLAAAIVALWKAMQRWLERRRDGEFALSGAPSELAIGLGFGFALFSVMTGIVAALGGFEVLGLRGAGAIWPMLAMGVTTSVFEETLFRGILFRHLETMLGSWAALVATSGLFGLAHLSNPDSSAFAAFAIAMEAGILLGAAYMLTRRLWLAIGIHAAWNFTQGWVFSIPVSGGDAPLGLLITRRVGPEWLTGGDFGLEASVVAMIVATIAGVAMLVRAIGKGRLVGPMWVNSAAE